MTFRKSAVAAAIVAAAALGMSMTAANAHGKKHHHHRLHGPSMIILSTSVDPCIKWYHLYLKTGRIGHLHTYRVCSR